MRLVGRKYGRDSRTLVDLLDSTLDLVAVGIRSGMGDMRTKESEGVARDRQMASESEQRAVTWWPLEF